MQSRRQPHPHLSSASLTGGTTFQPSPSLNTVGPGAGSKAAVELDLGGSGENSVWRFGRFELDPVRRRLAMDGAPVKLPPTQFDTLLYLAQHPHRVVEKNELMAAVWGARVVEEGNLSQAVFLLRRALKPGDGESYIITAPGRGYRFTAALERSTPSFIVQEPQSATPAQPSTPPAPPPRRRPVARRILLLGSTAAATAIILAAIVANIHTGFHPPRHSVAVLAFTNMSGDRQQEYFSDGLSEELINALSRVQAIQVAARMSSFTFKNTTATISQVARTLNVGTVLEGSVRRDATHLRVTAQLIDAVTGYQLWSRSYDGDLNDTLELETEIATAVAQSLEVSLLADQKAQLTTGGTNNPEAFNAYLRGTSQMRLFAQSSYRAAQAAFEQATSLDPSYADAHASLAAADTFIAVAWTPQPGMVAMLAQARAEADQAVALAPGSAQAHAARGVVLTWQTDLRGANRELSLAHALAPNDILVERSYAGFQAMMNHPEQAERSARHMVDLDPLTSGEYRRLGIVLVYARKYREAVSAFQREAALGAADPDRSKLVLAMAHLALADWSAAQTDCATNHYTLCLAYQAIATQKLGQTAPAQAALAAFQAAASGMILDYMNAEIFAQWGNRPTALHWLQAAATAAPEPISTDSIIALRADPLMDPIRNTPEYKNLERRLNFPP